MMAEIPGTWPDMPAHNLKSPRIWPLAALNSSHAAKATSVIIGAKQVYSRTPIGLETVVGKKLSGCSPSIDSSSHNIFLEKSTDKSGVSILLEFRTSGPVLRPVHSEGWGELKVRKQNVPETASSKSNTRGVKVPSDETCSKSILKVPRQSHGHPNVSISYPSASIPTAPIFASVRPTPGPSIYNDGPHELPTPARAVSRAMAHNPCALFSSTRDLQKTSRPRVSITSSRASLGLDSDDWNIPEDVDVATETRDSVGDLEGVRRHLSESETVSRACMRAEKAAANWEAQGHFAAAVDSYSDALQFGVEYSREKRARLFFNRAECYEELGLYRRAVRDCNVSLDLVPESVLVLAHRANLFESLDKFRLARADYKTLRRLVPQCAQFAAGAIRMAQCM